MFPESEFKDRVSKVMKAMSEVKLDALVLFDDDKRIGGGNVRYLTNYYHLFSTMPMAVVITPPDVALCVTPGGMGDGPFDVAKIACPWIKTVLGSRGRGFGAGMSQDIKTILEKAGIKGKVGVDGLGGMFGMMYNSVKAALKDYQLVEETGIVEKIRILKSPNELKAIREAVRLADIGVNTFIDSFKVGEPQYISMTKATNAAKLAGSEDVLIYMGVGAPWIWGEYPSTRIYQQGDMIGFEFNARYEGYWGQVNRSCILGRPTDKQKHVYQVAYDAYKAIEDAVKPGIKCSELNAIGAKIVSQGGFETRGLRMGHGMGLTIAEGFDIAEQDQTILQPGNYIMDHTLVTIFAEGICACMGNPLFVNDKSFEALSKAKFQQQI